MKKILPAVALFAFGIFVYSVIAFSATTSQVNTYSNGNVLTADQLNSEFGNLYATINSLNQANIVTGAAIEPAKLSSTIAGAGIGRDGTTGVLSVNVDSTIQITADVLGIDDLPGSALATGAVGSTQLANGGVAKIDLAVKTTASTATLGNVGLSSSTGAGLLTFTTTSMGDLVNNQITITTNGGPVQLTIMPGTSTTNSYIECEEVTTDPCTLELDRGGSTVVKIPFYTEGHKYRLPPGAFTFLDTQVAGTYTYKIKYDVGSATALRILNVRLMAIEL